MIAVPPSAAVFVILNPGGNEPPCNSKVTFPADSGSVAFTVTLTEAPSLPVANDPDAVVNTG